MGTTLARDIGAALRQDGARVAILGEFHSRNEHVKLLQKSFSDLRADGHTTLYLELGEDRQKLLNNALAGDHKAQRDLRFLYEQMWGYGGSETAQTRYDMLFEARRAGLRVLCVDMDDRQNHMYHYNKFENEDYGLENNPQARYAMGNRVMANNIARLDDGGKAIMLVGANHTGAFFFKEGIGPPNIVYEGIDKLLTQKGIRATGIDFIGTESDTGLERADGVEQNFTYGLKQSPIPEDPPRHIAATSRQSWKNLADLYGNAADISLDAGLRRSYRGVEKDLLGLSDLLDSPSFLNRTPDQQAHRLAQAAGALHTKVEMLEPTLPDEPSREASRTRRTSLISRRFEPSELFESIVDDNIFLQTPGAKTLWERPSAVPGAKIGQSADYADVAESVVSALEDAGKTQSRAYSSATLPAPDRPVLIPAALKQ